MQIKKILLLACLAPALMLMSFAGRVIHTDVYLVDGKQSSLEWTGEKLTGKHTGTIAISKGQVMNNHGKIGGHFEFDMNTITSTDLTGNGKEKIERHLKSEDFFDVSKYPKATFIITSVTPIANAKSGEATHQVNGSLTLKNKTNDISFPATIKMDGNKLTCDGTAIVDRSKFDVRYASKSFFADIGDKAIYDEFALKFNVTALK